MSERDDRARDSGLLGAGFVAGEPEEPAVCAARVVAEQALSIFEAAEATASESHDRGRRQADELVAQADQAAALALGRLEALSRELDALAAELDRRAEQRLAVQGHGG